MHHTTKGKVVLKKDYLGWIVIRSKGVNQYSFQNQEYLISGPKRT